MIWCLLLAYAVLAHGVSDPHFSLPHGGGKCANNSECNKPQGHCENGRCACAAGYLNDHCQWRRCADDLSCSHGTCDKKNGVCVCNQGWLHHMKNECDLQNPCMPHNPCLNEGECTPDFGSSGTSFKCTCHHYYTGKRCDTLPPLDIHNRTINIHIVMHTHDDLGWDWTVQQYYEGTEGPGKGLCVRKILTDGISQLLEDPGRRFSYVEIGFFELWWREQNNTMKDTVKSLVASGQLEFVSAGWCMNDEATVHFSDAIDQMTLGHLWLHANFGTTVVPDQGWQIDPFGHTTTQAMLFSKMGFNMLHFTRAPDGTPGVPQFVWRPSSSVDGLDLWTYFYGDYGYFVECQMNCLEGDFVNWANYVHGAVSPYKTPNLLLPYGGDFSVPNFPEADQLVKGIPQEKYKVNVTYSTPSNFYKTIRDYNGGNPDGGPWDAFAPPNNDFFPYWTGFFTSQSEFKGLVRKMSGFLHASWALHTLAKHSNWHHQGEMLNVLWEALGIAQHHDAVTGTATREVYADYTRRLKYGMRVVSEAVVAPIISDSVGGHLVHVCEPGSRPAMCKGIREGLQNRGITVSITNPVAWVRDEAVEIETAPGFYLVTDTDGNNLLSQTTPLPNGNVTLMWIAKALSPLGTTFFTIKSVDAGVPQSSVAATISDIPRDGAILENEFLLVTLNGSGRLHALTSKASGLTRLLNVDVLFYRGSTQDDGDDAYDFLAAGNEPFGFGNDTLAASLVQGPLRKEVCVRISQASHIHLCIGLISGQMHVNVHVGLGPVDVSDNVGKDIILRVNSNIASNGVFYTDSQGLELMRRIRGNGTWNQSLGLTPGKNYYPVTTMSMINEPHAQLALLSDRAQGSSSMIDGSLEMMIYRRILHCSDAKGLVDDDALNRNSTVDTTHWLLLGEPKETAKLMRQLAVTMYNPVVVTVTPSVSNISLPSKLVQPLARPLPSNLQLLNLQVLQNNFTVSCGPGCDIPSPFPHGNPDAPPPHSSALHTGTVILRLAHIYAIGEGEHALWQPASVDLKEFFTMARISSVTEYSLTLLQPFTAMRRIEWPMKQMGSFSQHSCLNGTRVTIGPMDIRTFVIRFESVEEPLWV